LAEAKAISGNNNSKSSVLSVSYDEPLLYTREWMLKAEGLKVSSAAGFVEGMKLCRSGSFDLGIIGHSIPRTDKLALITEFKKHSKAPVLSIVRHGDPPLPEADYWVDAADGPEALIRIVKKALDGEA
jgi:DNA-binding NtrC family response regulator